MGDIFGAPLAIEGLTSFFLESTFLDCGSLAGRDYQEGAPSRHLAGSDWLEFISYVDPDRNSFMQNPVGYGIEMAER